MYTPLHRFRLARHLIVTSATLGVIALLTALLMMRPYVVQAQEQSSQDGSYVYISGEWPSGTLIVADATVSVVFSITVPSREPVSNLEVSVTLHPSITLVSGDPLTETMPTMQVGVVFSKTLEIKASKVATHSFSVPITVAVDGRMVNTIQVAYVPFRGQHVLTQTTLGAAFASEDGRLLIHSMAEQLAPGATLTITEIYDAFSPPASTLTKRIYLSTILGRQKLGDHEIIPPSDNIPSRNIYNVRSFRHWRVEITLPPDSPGEPPKQVLEHDGLLHIVGIAPLEEFGLNGLDVNLFWRWYVKPPGEQERFHSMVGSWDVHRHFLSGVASGVGEYALGYQIP